MSDDLFPDCKQDSPRLAWMKKHVIRLEHDGRMNVWTASRSGRVATGDSDKEAITHLAVKLGIPLWNEEKFADK